MRNETNFELFIKALSNFIKVIAEVFEALKIAIDHVVFKIKALYDVLYKAYVNEGARYGETTDGFLQWMQDEQYEEEGEGE